MSQKSETQRLIEAIEDATAAIVQALYVNAAATYAAGSAKKSKQGAVADISRILDHVCDSIPLTACALGKSETRS